MPTDPWRWEMADDAVAAILRRMTPGERLSIAFDIFRMARRTLWAQVELGHPDWTTDQINREVARKISQGAVPPGCDLAGYFSHLRAAGQSDDNPLSADEPLVLDAEVG